MTKHNWIVPNFISDHLGVQICDACGILRTKRNGFGNCPFSDESNQNNKENYSSELEVIAHCDHLNRLSVDVSNPVITDDRGFLLVEGLSKYIDSLEILNQHPDGFLQCKDVSTGEEFLIRRL